MDANLAAALVTGALALIGTLVTVYTGQKRLRQDIAAQLEQHNAVQDERIRHLTETVERHNSVIERTYILEGKVTCLSNRVTDLANRTGFGGEDC